MSQLEFKVTGMVCDGCSSTVQKVITGLAGVSSATSDHVSGATSVEHDPSACAPAVIYQAVRDAGFGVSVCGNPACKCSNCHCDPCQCN